MPANTSDRNSMARERSLLRSWLCGWIGRSILTSPVAAGAAAGAAPQPITSSTGNGSGLHNPIRFVERQTTRPTIRSPPRHSFIWLPGCASHFAWISRPRDETLRMQASTHPAPLRSRAGRTVRRRSSLGEMFRPPPAFCIGRCCGNSGVRPLKLCSEAEKPCGGACLPRFPDLSHHCSDSEMRRF